MPERKRGERERKKKLLTSGGGGEKINGLITGQGQLVGGRRQRDPWIKRGKKGRDRQTDKGRSLWLVMRKRDDKH